MPSLSETLEDGTAERGRKVPGVGTFLGAANYHPGRPCNPGSETSQITACPIAVRHTVPLDKSAASEWGGSLAFGSLSRIAQAWYIARSLYPKLTLRDIQFYLYQVLKA